MGIITLSKISQTQERQALHIFCNTWTLKEENRGKTVISQKERTKGMAGGEDCKGK